MFLYFNLLDPYARQEPVRAGQQMPFHFNNLQVYNCLIETGQDPGRNMVLYLNLLDPYARQEPGRAGQQMHYHFNNLHVYNCLIETGQDPGRNIFLYFNLLDQYARQETGGSGSRFTFTVTISKSTTALQKPDRIRVETYFCILICIICQIGIRQGRVADSHSP